MSEASLLAGLLAIIGNQKEFEKKIIQLQDKRNDIEDATRLARDEQKKAQDAVASILKREAAVKAREDAAATTESKLDDRSYALNKYKGELDDASTEAMKRENTHKEVVKAHGEVMKDIQAKATANQVAQAALDKRAEILNAEHNERMSKVAERETKVALRESAVQTAEDKLKEKAEAARKLWA